VTGLPDGLFSNQKSQFGKILEGLRMKNAGIIDGYLEYFTVIWYISWPFGNVVVICDIFPHFWHIVSGIIWQPRSVKNLLLIFSARTFENVLSSDLKT
jgi:hypothetical protein